MRCRNLAVIFDTQDVYMVTYVNGALGRRVIGSKIQGDQNVSVHLTITVQKPRKNTVF